MRLRLLPVLAIMAYAAVLRLNLPSAPFADSDTWGYIAPSIDHFLGRGFPQTYGRAFLYPSFVCAVLGMFQSFAAIALVQHFLGLVAGVILWSAWENLRASLPTGRLYAILHYALGLTALSWLLLNNTVLAYEHSLRPESLFPFASAVLIWLTARAFTQTATAPAFTWSASMLCAGHGIFYTLHPIFGFATVACCLPVTVRALWARTAWWRRLAVPASLPITLALLAGAQSAVYTSKDPTEKIFGAMTLFAFHADVVVRELDGDLAKPEQARYPAALLRLCSQLIHEELDRNTRSGQSQGTLTYDADRLIYHPDSVCVAVRKFYRNDPHLIADFFLHYFLHGALANPQLYLAKVGRNLQLVLGPESKLLSTVPEQLDLAGKLNYSRESLTQPYVVILSYPAGAAYEKLLEPSPRPEQPWNLPDLQRTIVVFCMAYRPLLAATVLNLAGLTLACMWTRAVRFLALRRLAVISTALFGYNIFICLTVSLVSSLDNDRYTENQLTFTLFTGFTALLLLSCLLVALLPLRLRTLVGAA